ncbi:MAG: aminotransferase [Gammaproteobacteria bacterium]|nr:MAG: aminotransferase [Gammaproteobacteria bacterium]
MADLSELIEREFPQDPSVAYLNHAGVAPWPQRAARAAEAFARECVARGASHYRDWEATEARLREQLRNLINAPSVDDIALLKNTSEGLSCVAFGLDWQSGDNVVISDQEFPANRLVWEALASRGVEVRKACLADADTPENALLNLCDDRTRVLAISSVQYATGLRMDLGHLGAFCRNRETLFCVDAIQSIGAVPVDVQAIDADFVAGDGHKWMLGAEGVAVFYCRAEVRPQLRLNEFGWHTVTDPMNFDRQEWTIAESAKRFECGSLNMLGIHVLSASLSLLQDVGMDVVSRNVLNKTQYIIDYIDDSKNIFCVTPAAEERRAGIVSFRAGSGDQRPLYRQLQENGVVCALRHNAVRFSPHFYTRDEVLKRALAIVGDYAGRP